MVKWGVSFGSHDAALSVVDNDRILFASHSERFSKIKDDPNLCAGLVKHAILQHGPPSEIVFHENTLKKRVRYLRSGQFDLFFERSPRAQLRDLIDLTNIEFHSVDHHQSHAAAGYFTSGVTDATIVVMDAIGEMATTTVWEGTGRSMVRKYQQNYPHSIGLFYSAMTQAAGLKPNGEEYIFMGMAAYGDPSRYLHDLMDQFIDLSDPDKIFGLKKNLHRGAGNFFSKNLVPEDLAAASQEIYTMVLKKTMDYCWNNHQSKNLILMGGCALNCVANSRIQGWHPWDRVWIMPNPGDAGSSLGAVLAKYSMHVAWPGPYLGYDIRGEYPIEPLISQVTEHGISAVANGPAEFGPRALGNRSILADPRIPDMKKRMNWLKKREQFRPFAAVIPQGLAHQFFEMNGRVSSPYMQHVYQCKHPESYPGIVHVDGTCRIQTISEQQHPGLHEMLLRWYDRTGCPMMANTSLNIKNQPLVNDELDAAAFSREYHIPVFTGA